MLGIGPPPGSGHERQQLGTPAFAGVGRIAAGVAVAGFAAHIVGGQGCQFAQVGDRTRVDIAVVVAVEQEIEGFLRYVPGVADAAVVIGFVGVGLA